MRRWIVGLAIFCSSAVARAETAFSVAVDVGLSTHTSESQTFETGYSSLNLGVAIERDRWTFSIEGGVPIPPSITIQTPISFRLHPFGSSRTRPFLVARLRPIYFTLVGCQNCENFLRQDQRPPSAWGVTGDGGLGYQFEIGSAVMLDVSVAYTGGYLVPRELNVVNVARGVYQGGVFRLGFSIDL